MDAARRDGVWRTGERRERSISFEDGVASWWFSPVIRERGMGTGHRVSETGREVGAGLLSARQDT